MKATALCGHHGCTYPVQLTPSLTFVEVVLLSRRTPKRLRQTTGWSGPISGTTASILFVMIGGCCPCSGSSMKCVNPKLLRKPKSFGKHIIVEARCLGCCTKNPHNTLLIYFHFTIRPQNPNGLTASQRVEFSKSQCFDGS